MKMYSMITTDDVSTDPEHPTTKAILKILSEQAGGPVRLHAILMRHDGTRTEVRAITDDGNTYEAPV